MFFPAISFPARLIRLPVARLCKFFTSEEFVEFIAETKKLAASPEFTLSIFIPLALV
jgi:hypothetical protein